MGRTQGFPVLLIGLAVAAASAASAQSAGGKKPASHVCFMDGCFDEYIVSLKRASSGLVTVRTRLDSHCYPGSNCTEEPSKFYTVRCANPGGYIEYNGRRTPEPELDPPHATQRISSFGPLSVQAWLGGVETEDGCSIV
jgi:hypothetical protein